MVTVAKNARLRIEKTEKLFSLAEYLRLEEQSTDKHEYHNGKIIKMGNTKFYHNLVATNTSRVLGNAIVSLPKTFLIVGDGQKIYIEPENKVVYPDGLAIFEKPEFHGKSQVLVTNPLLVIEVLSPRTEKYDESGKFASCCLLPSFKEYMLIDPRKFSIQIRYKNEKDEWETQNQIEATGSLHLRSLRVSLALAGIYANVVFPKKK
ncbi:MAG: Uma2 family endonuclease [Saprospiraceae bacterium]|nr:Uma2 family endonuclease [Saprospiraceae bacterium]